MEEKGKKERDRVLIPDERGGGKRKSDIYSQAEGGKGKGGGDSSAPSSTGIGAEKEGFLQWTGHRREKKKGGKSHSPFLATKEKFNV